MVIQTVIVELPLVSKSSLIDYTESSSDNNQKMKLSKKRGVDMLLNLFPLSKIDPALEGYYLDAKYDLWSTKRNVTPVKIKNPRNRIKYPKYATGFDTLVLSLRKNPEWVDFVTGKNVEGVTVKNSKKESFPMHVIALLDGDGVPKFSSKPKVHADGASAQAETERLARENPGQRFAHFYCLGICSSKGITWE